MDSLAPKPKKSRWEDYQRLHRMSMLSALGGFLFIIMLIEGSEWLFGVALPMPVIFLTYLLWVFSILRAVHSELQFQCPRCGRSFFEPQLTGFAYWRGYCY